MNTKILNNNQIYILTLFIRCFKSVLICANLWPESFLPVLHVLYDLHGKNKKIRVNLRNPRLNICFCSSLWPKTVFPRFPSETQTEIKNMRSKANLTIAEFTLTREMNEGYNNLHQNDHKKAKPIQTQSKPNPKPIQSQFEDSPKPLFFEAAHSEVKWRRTTNPILGVQKTKNKNLSPKRNFYCKNC